MPAEGVSHCAHRALLRFEEIVEVIEQLQCSFDVRTVRLTGGDPLARKGTVDLVGMLSDRGIHDLAMTTNAQELKTTAAPLRAAGLRRVNISLDSLNPATFRRLTRVGLLGRTVEGIDSALAAGLRPVKLNTVVMKGINDREVCDLLSFALDRGCELRFLELMPIGYSAPSLKRALVETAAVRRRLASQFEITPLVHAAGETARRWRVVRRADSVEGVVGFISACSNTFCHGCARVRITSDGRLIGCLARDRGVAIRPLLRCGDPGVLAEAVRRAFTDKRSDASFTQSCSMAAIGG